MENKNYSTGTQTPLEQAQILVVEDELILAEDIRINLTALGYSVPDAVVSGEEAVRQAEEMRPDLVLMDIKLQGEMDGIEAAEQIRVRFDIPVIYITAFSDDATLQRAKIAEPFGYVIKPVETRELHATVEMALYRHKLETRLKENERWLDTTLRSIGDGVIATDDVGRVTFMNPVAEGLTGWKQADAVGHDLTEVFHIVNEATREAPALSKAEGVENPVARVLREGVIVGLANHTLLIRKDGTEIPIDDSGAPIRDDDGTIIGVVLTFRDITERKRAEEALRESEERYRTIFETAGVSIWEEDFSAVSAACEELQAQGVTDLRRYLHEHPEFVRQAAQMIKIVDVNETTVKMFGATSKADLLMSLDRIMVPETLDIFRKEILAIAEGRTYFEGETVNQTLDGKHLNVLLTMRIPTEAEKLNRVLVSLMDITERKRLEKQLHQHERLAAVGQLAAGIAHDFRNLLTTIILYANMGLRKPDLPPNLAQNLETIIGESKKAADLVQQILDFSSRAMIQVQPLDLASFIEEVAGILRRTIPENIRLALETRPEKDTTSLTVAADPTRIQQVLMNLATNARDAMPNGGELRFALSRIQLGPNDEPPVADMPLPSSPSQAGGIEGGQWVCLAVSDTGTGMTDKVRAHLFEPFFTTKEVGKGTGLGLAQVYGIVRQHEGYVGVETEVGKGTTFRIYLPATRTETDIVEKKVSAMPQGQGETILLVEDNEKLQEAEREILESLGYRVLVATNGREALEIYQIQGGADLVITDIVMPEMGGRELVQELGKTDPNLKAIGITGYAAEKVVVELGEMRFLDVIHKPFDIKTLARAIRSALDAD